MFIWLSVSLFLGFNILCSHIEYKLPNRKGKGFCLRCGQLINVIPHSLSPCFFIPKKKCLTILWSHNLLTKIATLQLSNFHGFNHYLFEKEKNTFQFSVITLNECIQFWWKIILVYLKKRIKRSIVIWTYYDVEISGKCYKNVTTPATSPRFITTHVWHHHHSDEQNFLAVIIFWMHKNHSTQLWLK